MRPGLLPALCGEFRLVQVKNHQAAGSGVAAIKMWPSSALLRLFVSPAYLLFSEDGRAFRGMIGRLLPVGMREGRPHAIDGELRLDQGG